MRRKHAAYGLTNFKAVPTDEGGGEGIFEAIVSVFGNTDLVGDRMVPGAFTKSLERWSKSDAPLSVYWDHDWKNPESNIGEVLEAAELEPGDERLPEPLKNLGGLWIKAQLDIDEERANQVFEKMKRRRLREFSFAYDIVDERKADDGVNELIEVELIEVTTTFKGANPATELVSIKNNVETLAMAVAEIKSGRVLSAKNESKIKQAIDLLTEVVKSVANDSAEEEKAAVEESGRSMTSEDEATTTGEKAAVEESGRSMTPGDLRRELEIELAATA